MSYAPADAMRDIRRICSLMPSHDVRKALTRHLVHLNREIIDAEERGEATQVTRGSYDCIMQMVDVIDEIKSVRVALNGGKNERGI